MPTMRADRHSQDIANHGTPKEEESGENGKRQIRTAIHPHCFGISREKSVDCDISEDQRIVLQVAEREAWKRLTESGGHPLGEEPAWGRVDRQQVLREEEQCLQERTRSYQEALAAQIAEKEREKQARFIQEQAAREEQIEKDRREAQLAKQEEVAKT